jgi:uncharacterized protein (DUF433 family)
MLKLPDTISVPLRVDDNDDIRVGDTRVLLDMVVYAFRQGATAETIVDKFPSLSLPDVYNVIGYYLQHKEAVDAYIRQREQVGEALRKQIEAEFPIKTGLRERLLAGLEAKKQHA